MTSSTDNPRRFLILGGTGPCGVEFIRETLETYPTSTIVVYARAPEKLPEDLSSHASLTIIKGQLTDSAALESAIEGVDVVLSALGPGANHPTGTPLAKAYEELIKLMKRKQVKRIILLGTGSIKDPQDKFSYVYTALVWGVATFAPQAYADIVAIGETFKTKVDDLDWTIVRVPMLHNKDSKAVIAGHIGDGKTGTTLARKGFAHFVVEEVAARAWIRERPLISSA